MNTILEKIQDAQNKLNCCLLNNSCQSFFEAAKGLQSIKDNYVNLRLEGKQKSDYFILICKSILYPFSIKIIALNNENISLKMASFILWWLRQKPPDVLDQPVLVLLKEKRKFQLQHLTVQDCVAGRERARVETSNITPTFDFIFALFDIKASGKDCDNLIALIKQCIDKRLEILFDPNIKEIWKLYFDPLCIENVIENDQEFRQLIGNINLTSLGAGFNRILNIDWSDKRSDRISSITYSRERVDPIVHHLFKISTSEICLNILDSIPNDLILSNIKLLTNDRLKEAINRSLSRQFIILINAILETGEDNNINEKSIALFTKIIKIINENYQFLMISKEFGVPIANTILEYPILLENSDVVVLFSSFIPFLLDEYLIISTRTLIQKLEEIREPNINLKYLLILTSICLKEISKRKLKIGSPSLSKWLQKEFIIENVEFQEIIHGILEGLLSISSVETFLNLIEIYLSSEYNIYVVFLAKASTTQILKTIKDNLKTEDFLKFYDAINKLADNCKQFAHAEDLKFSLQIFLNFCFMCLDIIREDPVLLNKFTQKSFIIQLVDSIKIMDKIIISISTFNLLLNLTSNLKYSENNELKNEIVEHVINDSDTFARLYNAENMFLLLNLIDTESSKDDLLTVFLTKIVEISESDKVVAKMFFSSLQDALDKVNNEIKTRITNCLRGFVGVFIEMLVVDELEKIAITILCRLLNFNEQEKKSLVFYFGLDKNNAFDKDVKNPEKKDPLFFISENLLKMKQNGGKYEPDEITRNDFDDVIKNLKENLKQLEGSNHMQGKQIMDSNEFNYENVGNSLNFVWTQTTRSNLNKILQAQVSPILLEGGTGIGKSATIQIASEITKNKLIRFNMSSRVTIDDFLGKVVIAIDQKTNKDTFEFKLSPFSIAFKEGTWLLLDEMNLAQDNVLQCIENALDSKILSLHNPCNSTQPIEIINMHENFRLFATQNPSVGFFKGKREKLSQSLLDRFTVYYFDELPIDEWVEIAQNKLSKSFSNDEAKSLSQIVVKSIHMIVKEKTGEKKFQEKAAYAEITIRELFKLCERLIFLKRNNYYSASNLSYCSFLTYGTRFRDNGRTVIIKILESAKLPIPNLEIQKYSFLPDNITFDDVKIKNYRLENSDTFGCIPEYDHRMNYLCKIKLIHENVENLCVELAFIQQHGFYMVENSWMFDWFNQIEKANKSDWDLIGLSIYLNKFRHLKAKEKAFECFKKVLNLNIDISKVNQTFSINTRPFVITTDVLNIWKQIAWNLDSSYPILLTGIEGCGKTETIYAFSRLTRMELTQVCLTPETEASHLVGQYNPNDGPGEKIMWQDGYVTEAFRKGNWVLLDNFNQGDSCVLERLNPLLENEPIWVLTENRETESLPKKDNFKVFATMTISNKTSSSYPELSPALYNRFSIIHMENSSFDNENKFKQDIMLMAQYSLDTQENIVKAITDICWLIHIEVNMKNKNKQYGVITLRNFVRLIDVFYILSNKFQTVDYTKLLWKCYKVCFESQFKFGMSQKSELYNQIKSYLAITDEWYLKDMYEFDDKYILTESRTEFLETVLTCIECAIPILLEGKSFGYFYLDFEVQRWQSLCGFM